MDKRWGLNIDIEGFSSLYEHSEEGKTKATRALHDLMDAVVKIGRNAYPGDPTKNEKGRIFAHQFGDGFILVSDYEEPDATRCISIGIALMRHMMMKGIATKVAISTGDMSDIKGCYPPSIRSSDNGTISLGAGLLTTIPVMGTALTKAHKLSARMSGCVLIVDLAQFTSYPSDWVLRQEKGIGVFDWKADGLSLPNEIASNAKLHYGSRSELHGKFEEYIVMDPTPPEKWISASRVS